MRTGRKYACFWRQRKRMGAQGLCGVRRKHGGCWRWKWVGRWVKCRPRGDCMRHIQARASWEELKSLVREQRKTCHEIACQKKLEMHPVLSVGGFRDIDLHTTCRVCFVSIVQELVVYVKCNTDILTIWLFRGRRRMSYVAKSPLSEDRASRQTACPGN